MPWLRLKNIQQKRIRQSNISGDLGGDNRERYIEPKETEEEKKQRLAKAEIERNKANGLKEFFYGENSLWALNQKKADKKARSKHWL